MIELSKDDKFVLRQLMNRPSLGLKKVISNNDMSYRQSLRHITNLCEKNVIKGWIPLIHPFIYPNIARKHMWFWLKTNPQKPEELNFFKTQKDKIHILDGIAGTFSLIALFKFSTDQEFLSTLEQLGHQFSVVDPLVFPMRYQWREILAYHKMYGVKIPSTTPTISKSDILFLDALIKLGVETSRSPTVLSIAHELEKSSSTIQRQIKQLEENNVIIGYGIQINSSIRPQCKFLVQLQIDPRFLPTTIQILEEDIHTHFLCRIQDNYSILAIVYTNTIAEFNSWLKLMYKYQGIMDSLSTVVLHEELHNVNSNMGFPLL